MSVPCLTEKDIADVAVGAETGVDYIALSFVREAAVRALGASGDARGKAALASVARSDPEASLRALAKSLIEGP